MARKHVCAPPRRNVLPTESHSNGQDGGYFLRTLYQDPKGAMWKLVPTASAKWSRLLHRGGRSRPA
jgi:hypothetical protein